MKPVRVRSVSPTQQSSAPAGAIDRKLDALAAIAAVLTLLAAILGLYIAWVNLRTDAASVVVV